MWPCNDWILQVGTYLPEIPRSSRQVRWVARGEGTFLVGRYLILHSSLVADHEQSSPTAQVKANKGVKKTSLCKLMHGER